eukprot:1066246-Pelagomonas_calceolata.AAC.1
MERSRLAHSLYSVPLTAIILGYKGKRPQSRRLTTSLFIKTHEPEVMKKKRKASRGRCGGVGKRSFAQKVRHTFDGESRPGDWSI